MRQIKILRCLFSICMFSGILLLTPLTASAHATQTGLSFQQARATQLLRGGGGGGHGSGGSSSGGHSIGVHEEESSGGSYHSGSYHTNSYHNSSYYSPSSCQAYNTNCTSFPFSGCLTLLLIVGIIYAISWAVNKRKRRDMDNE